MPINKAYWGTAMLIQLWIICECCLMTELSSCERDDSQAEPKI